MAGAPLTKPAAPKPAEKKQTLQTTTKSEASKPTRLETATSANTSGTSTPKTDGKAATKKAGKVDIFAAFSKGKQKPKATAEPEDGKETRLWDNWSVLMRFRTDERCLGGRAGGRSQIREQR